MTGKLCPKCGQPMTLDTEQGMFSCPVGHHVAETLDEASERIRAKGQRPVVTRTFRGQLDPRALSLFESAQDYLWRGDKAAALDALHDAVDVQPDFTDAHLWIARTTDDMRLKREHIERLLAYDPGNLDGIRELMVLDGKLTLEEAERSRHTDTPTVRQVESIKAQTQTLKCPVCGGALTIDETNQRVVCKFCGHIEPLNTVQTVDDGAETLGAALIERRVKGVTWVIGDRLLHCQQCGAERTIPQGRLSGQCPFCGSKAVITRDTADSFQQPDGLIPFTVDEDAAKAAILDRLKRMDERLYALRGENRLAHAALEGVYVPFWVFDALIDVSQTIQDKRMPSSREQVRQIQPYQNLTFQDGMIGICVPAVKSPPSQLVAKVGEFGVDQAVAYDPKLLAKYPAALYTVDFDEASLEARSMASARMRDRHGHSSSSQVEVTIFALIKQMTFTLLLMPMWVGTLVEHDGDVRTALVNGQNGQVAIGAARKEEG